MFDEAKKYLQKVETVDRSGPMLELTMASPAAARPAVGMAESRLDRAMALALASPTQNAVAGAGRRQELSPVARSLSVRDGIGSEYLGSPRPSAAPLGKSPLLLCCLCGLGRF